MPQIQSDGETKKSAGLKPKKSKRAYLSNLSQGFSYLEKVFSAKPFALYLLVFLIPVVIMYLAYALFGVHPFGNGSVLVLDLNAQYVYYYEAFRDAILGDGGLDSLIYSWSRNLSGDMFGIFAYYISSPFMFVILLFPRSAMCGAVEAMQLLKIGSAAVTFAFYLRNTAKVKAVDEKNFKRAKNTSVVIFSTMYALMSYMVVQLMDPMWLDGLIYLPLICLGVEKLIYKGKMLPLAIPLALMFISHFYIGYMVGIFTFFYFVYCYFGIEGRRVPKRWFSSILKFAGSAVTAILTACGVLLPIYNALKLGKLEFSTPDWSMATQFDFLTFLTKLFPLSYDTVYPDGLPMIYCGTAVLILVPLFFMNKKISVKRKASSGLLLALTAVLMYIRPTDIVLHGFQVPNWLPYRYSFVFSFLLLIMAYEAFENLDGISFKEIGGVFFGLMVYLIWCERENYEHFEIFRSVTDSDGETSAVIGGIWFSALALAVYFLMLYLKKKYTASRILCFVLCVAVGVEMLANSMDTLQKIDEDVVYSDYTSYEPYMSNTIDAVEHIQQFDDSVYRMEATTPRSVNDPMGTGYSGISHSSSVMNTPALLLLQQLGYAYGGNYTSYNGATLITDSIFNIKYLMDIVEDDSEGDDGYQAIKIPDEYKLATHIEEDGATYKFYQNPYAMGWGVVCDENINSIEMVDDNPFENQNVLYSALASGDGITEYFTRIVPKNMETENVTTATLTDGKTTKFYATDESAAETHVDYVVEMNRDGDLYMYLPTDYERSCTIWVLDEESYQNGDGTMDYAGQFFVGDNYSILNLGSFLKNQDVRIRITISNEDKEAFWSDNLFYTLDTEAFEQTAELLQSNSAQVTQIDNTSVTVSCNSDSDDSYLFTTVPYQEGWIIKVNGKEVSCETAVGALITIPLEEGENVIEMSFEPSYLTAGIVLSIVGLLCILLIFIFEYKDGRLIDSIISKLDGRAKEKDKKQNPLGTD
ncbi:MAG: YfhO family protein [Ruminococcus sp.]|nr:YfhO family protein [Ruminococcus sp.]